MNQDVQKSKDVGAQQNGQVIEKPKNLFAKCPSAIWKEIATKFLDGTLLLGRVHAAFAGVNKEIAQQRKWEKKCAEKLPQKLDPFRTLIATAFPAASSSKRFGRLFMC